MKKTRGEIPGEQPVDLEPWFGDGFSSVGIRSASRARKGRWHLSVGRSRSERGLGFVVSNGEVSPYDTDAESDNPHRLAAFVLDRDQCAALIDFLYFQLPRLRKPFAVPPRFRFLKKHHFRLVSYKQALRMSKRASEALARCARIRAEQAKLGARGRHLAAWGPPPAKPKKRSKR